MAIKITESAKKKRPVKALKKTNGIKIPHSAASLDRGIKTTYPVNLRPMLATLVDKPFDDEGWTYEVKWDGYRALAYVNNKKTALRSRNNKSFNEKFYPVYNTLRQWSIKAVIDGEIIVADENGLSNFSNLQNWRSEADGYLKFYIFDVLWYNGYSLLLLPLTERRSILRKIIPADDIVQVSENFEATGTEFFRLAEKMGLEGIIAKRADSLYSPGIRTKEWLKIKTAKRQEVIIGGYTKNQDSSKLFSSLLVGVYENNKFVYKGKIGTGFTEKTQKDIFNQMKPLVTAKSLFDTEPDVNKPSRFRPNPPKAAATWLKPRLICEVSYREITDDGVMRHPSFEGMRTDKNPEEVILEKAKSTQKLLKSEALRAKKIITASFKKERKTLLNPHDETQERNINGHSLKFTNLSKIYWPKGNITKRDMLNYYYQVAPYMLPYMKDRPQSLNRHPNGINGGSFYQKNVTGQVPGWIKTFPYHSEADGEDKNFLVCTDEASLLYIASLGCIEMNPWSSRAAFPDNPDWCIIDLDPDKNPFDKVIEAAQVTAQVLQNVGIDSYCKTSGSTGMHIYIPLAAKYTYEQSKEFARLIVKIVHNEIPRFTSIERLTSKRKGKLYLDFLQNRPQATLATAYSLRPKPMATVSTPLHWSEVKKGIKMTDFTIHTVPARLKNEGDIFKPVLGKGINLQKAIKNLETFL